MSAFTRFRNKVRNITAVAAPIAGAAVGSVFAPGVGTALGAQLGGMAGSAVATRPKQPGPVPPAPVGQSALDASTVQYAPQGLSLPVKIAIGAGVGVAVLSVVVLLIRRK